MGEIINSIGNALHFYFFDEGDFRTQDLPFMQKPFAVLALIVVYLKFCTSYGPSLMKDRKPFELRTAIKIYNIFQVLLSAFLMYEGLLYVLSKDYDIICDPITTSTEPRVYRAARSSWWYFFAKITELTETIFFVLRKKDRQVSTLHLYHHTLTVIAAWSATKFFPVGPIVLVGALNSFVHVLMYTYYFLAGLGPEYQKYLWWKKHVTLIQLVQFVIVIAHNTNGFFNNCNYPKLIHVFIIANTSLLFYMFSQFYYNNYIKPQPRKERTEEINGKVKVNNVRRTSRKSVSIGQ
ncbi:very long chain fatty acid elongase 7-like [Anticarsia gemmatalis]|uniref:very long chain fatty acid elongase 7-like n=1 Tax=Anticarsia gemmatalis TaxID=129554 RepID=UPI003F758898